MKSIPVTEHLFNDRWCEVHVRQRDTYRRPNPHVVCLLFMPMGFHRAAENFPKLTPIAKHAVCQFVKHCTIAP
jgi:hypothetical protein